MKNRELGVKIIALALIGFLTTSGVLYLNPQSFFSRAVCLSASTAMSGFNVKKATKEVFVQKPITDTVSQNKVADGNVVELTSRHPVSEAIEQNVYGNIIQKTVSVYNAKQNFGRVYMNNKCGVGIDIEQELSAELEFSVSKGDEPQILIYHTHATESYMLEDKSVYTEVDNTRTTDNTKNVIAVGDKIAEQLEAAGYSVIHDTTLHDYPGYTGSYTRSAETVKSILKEYPSIKIAIDVHRDSIASGNGDKIAPTVKVDGKEAAQVMLVMGSQTGSISGHPNWRQNLRLALKLQYVFESTYPQFARALSLKSAKYNQNLTTGSILVEMGSDANTLEQALYSGELVGRSLVTLLDSQ